MSETTYMSACIIWLYLYRVLYLFTNSREIMVHGPERVFGVTEIIVSQAGYKYVH
jgi:hypothetical protein